jgi:hypothetical protein
MSEIEKSLSRLNYEYKEIAPEIFIVKNFLKDEEVEKILSKINSLSQADWEDHYMRGIVDLARRKYKRTDIDNLVQEGLVEITNHWIDKNVGLDYEIADPISQRIKEIFYFNNSLFFEGVGTIQRQYEGAELTEHVDNHADPQIKYAVIMYINDDYTNGELFFSRLGLEIRPPKKSLVIFPSGENYLHGVRPPGAGPERYVLPSFVHGVNS